MKTNTAKVLTPARFSPLRHSSPGAITPPRPSRDACIKATAENMKLFADEPEKGQGALSSQVSETQYFAQSKTNTTPTFKMGTPGEEYLNLRMITRSFGIGSTTIMAGILTRHEHQDSLSESDIKHEHLLQDVYTLPQDIGALSPVEEWLIRRMRNELRGSNRFSDWLTGRDEIIKFLEGREVHHKLTLAEIHTLSTNHLRLLAEIQLLSRDLD
ncbi:hypothetical protein B0H17DRAFT_1123619 [Mycena rosella]|uniref:Uncharacterized protein n=1 Tax=Mycena rosella TaxID=1033263 RepID=A0AAD7H201_MYCRO|nr:hypothetical protein B0H17DRAFT_1123619 [Mycena rosella]